jgi:Flp pilus assembly pilin Flp
MQILRSIRDKIVSLLNDEGGQDVFEYVIIIGGVSVVVIAVLAAGAPGLMNSVIDGVCAAVDTAVPGPAFTC